jgi:hypothetical protein
MKKYITSLWFFIMINLGVANDQPDTTKIKTPLIYFMAINFVLPIKYHLLLVFLSRTRACGRCISVAIKKTSPQHKHND